jgi:hypothetical protein
MIFDASVSDSVLSKADAIWARTHNGNGICLFGMGSMPIAVERGAKSAELRSVVVALLSDEELDALRKRVMAIKGDCH